MPHAEDDVTYPSHESIDTAPTKFPGLTSTQATESKLRAPQKSVRLTDFRVPREVLILSWAHLLRCYTGEHEPVFLVDEKVVRVDLSISKVDQTGSLGTHLYSKGATRICFRHETSKLTELALELLYRPRDSLGILRGSSTLSNETLGQICRQLKEIIKQRTDVNESNLLWPLVSDLSLSVLNPDPRFLHGVERLHQVLEEHASKDAIALDHLGSDGNRQRFSYSTVDWLSTALALKLQSILRRPQSTNGARSHVVPILVPQTPELYIALIAILKAGAAFCPLNADAPKERVKFVARDVAADLIITTTANESLVSWDHGPEIFLLDNLDDIEMGQELPPLANVTADSLAYMMYTSGSTGKPKGVGISHMAVCQAILAHQEHIPTFDRLLQFAAPTFDVFVFEVFFTLFRGSTVVSCNRQEMLGDLPGTINRLEVDAVELTPTVVTGLLRTRASVPRLRLLLTIGEKLTNPIVKGFGESPQQNGILYGMYGPTEATIHCTLSSKMQSNHNASVIGVPLATVSSFIIEPRPLAGTSSGNFVVLPVGHIGELAIGGYQLTNGYNNRPEQNAQAFIDTPQHGRVYRTGDKARQLPGGELEYLGRLTSEQVKLRGQRLELGEIEDVLRSARGITNATAALIDDVLVAFCFTESDDITRHNVAEKCRLWLPRSMVPGDLVLLHEVPRLPSGKIDKGKLESDYRSGHNTMLSDQSSLDDDTEQHIADVARELLGDRYAGSKSLAAAGLDSLTAIRFTTRLQELGLNVGAVDILNADSVKDIGVLAKKNQLPAARRCVDDGDDRREDHASFRGIAMDQVRAVANPADIVDIIRCTPIQIAMLAETAINSQAYCNWIEVELPAKVSYLDVESALRRMATENEILRSGFLFLEGPPATYAQIIWTELSSSQLDTVSVFDRHFALNSIQSLLRPLRFSTACIDGRLHLLVQIHHALYDGWTWEHILSDLELILTNHNPPHRPQYRNIVDYFSKASKPNTNKPSLEFWTTQLNGLVVNPLPNFHGRNDIGQSLGFAHRKMKIIMRELEAISRELSVAPLAFFQAALAYLLSSYLGSSDIVFGTVSSGRTLPVNGVEHIMGPCITALPTRLDLACSQTVADLVRFLHRANRESLEHSAISLREIKRVTGIESGKLLFDVLIVWQQTTRPISSTPRLVTEINKADFLEYKLTLEIEPSRECIVVKANYQQAVFPHAQVDLILDQIDQLVECMALSAAKTLDEVGQCFGEGSLSIQNPLIQRPSDQETLTSCFERTAREDPQRAAIDFARLIVGNKIDLETLSYKRLNQRANQLAHFLLSQHVPTTGPVCICMEKSTALYISILAVIKAGLGYLPLTPETPPGRLQHILIEADVKLCLTTPTVRDTVRDTNDIHFFDAENLDCGNYPNTNLSLKYDGSNLAYAVFTSGSTGAPKGVLVTYENLRSNLSVLKAVYPMSRASRLLQSCSQAFDVSVFEIFFTWYSGGCLCSATKDVLFKDIENAIRVLKVTHLSLTPTAAALVDPMNVPTVEFLVTAGEGVTSKVFNMWSGKGLYQGYGPSETTNICTVKPRVEARDAINNIGPPLKNTSAFVASDAENFTILPRGALGEFCFGGDQVCRGYLNMPALTVSKFLDHPRFGRIYRSGDYGRLLADGSLLIVGRKDNQVKIRGQRVELGEINSRVLRTATVKDCTTLLIKAPRSYSEQLVAFWVPMGHSIAAYSILSADEIISRTTNELFEDLTSSLPSYMVPFALVPVTCLPSTPQSKIDNSKLITSFQSLSMEDRDLLSGRSQNNEEQHEFSSLEYIIANAVANVTKIPLAEVCRHTSFYSLGLDSISAIALSRTLDIAGYGDVGVSSILRSPTVASLSQRIPGDRGAPLPAKNKAYSPKFFNDQCQSQLKKRFDLAGKRVETILPCTPLQEAMLSTVNSTNAAYYNHLVFNVHGDLARLKACWEDLVSRHGILRTCFTITAHHRYAYAQVILLQHQPSWVVVETTPDKFKRVIKDQIQSKTGLMPESEPPYAFTVVATQETSVLILSMHHALYDGGAMSNILEEVESAYWKQPLPPVIAFDSFLGYMDASDLEEADKFWKEHLQLFEPTNFPNMTAHYTSTRSLTQIEDACKCLAVSLLSLSQSAWARILSIYLGESDICFGNVVSGRTIPLRGVERVVGPCFNTLPVRVRLNQQMTNVELMDGLQIINADSLPFQLTPLRRLQSKHSRENKRLFDTLFVLQQPTMKLDDHIWSLVEDLGAIDFPIVCEVMPNQFSDTLGFTLHYYRSLLSQSDGDLILRTLDATLQSIIDFPSELITDYSSINRDILSLVNEDSAIRSPPPRSLFHSGFEENVQSRPEASALDFLHFDGRRTIWSFEYLNQVSNQIAHALSKHRVQHDQAVPICMPKSPFFYASVLAVLKVGAAFTPVDPQAPTDRKRYMLDELQAKIVITSNAVDTSWINVSIFNVDDSDALKNMPKDNLHISQPTSANLAYRIYTSGSTGRPKAVSLEHRNAVQTIEESKSILPWTHSTRVLQYAATTFDMCYYDCFIAWTYGFCLCAAPQAVLLDNPTMVINKLGITMLDLTPTVASTLARESIPTVECLYCIGEAMPQQLIDAWAAKCLNSYGPTEAAMCCTIYPTNPEARSAIIGSPFPNTSFSVRAEGGKSSIPRLGMGELYIGGGQVARGYHANPELTKTSFVYTKDGQRLYKSGDMVRMLGNGHFEYLGRKDDQVKLRGLRVELAEINNVIKDGHPSISEVSTQVLKYSSMSQEQLVVFLGLPEMDGSERTPIVEEAARSIAKKKLPNYMVPHIYITIQSLPRSTAGKLDKKALLEVFKESQAEKFEEHNNTGDAKPVRAWSKDESTILRVLSNLSGIKDESIGHNMTIYELGLDSISAVQIAAQLRNKGMEIFTGDVIEVMWMNNLQNTILTKTQHPTISQLATFAGKNDRQQTPKLPGFNFAAFDKKHRKAICESLSIASHDLQIIRPCTPVQAGMIAQFLNSSGALYFNSLTMKLAQHVDIPALKDAWKAATAKYQMLRTGFANVNDIDHPFAMLTFNSNFAGLPWTERHTPLIRPATPANQGIESAIDVHQSLHLPTWRLRLEEAQGSRHLHFSALHALYDGQALQTILADVASIYHGHGTNIEMPFESTISTILDGSMSDANSSADFWRAYGTGTYIINFPNMAPLHEESKTIQVLSRTCSFTRSRLKGFCRHRGVTMQAAGQAAWARVLSAYTGESSVTFGLVLSGRNISPSAERIVFPCITTLPMSCKVQGSNDDLLQQIMSNTTALLKYQFTPLTKIQRMMGHPNEALFDSIFAYQKLIAFDDEPYPWEQVYEEATVDYAVSIELIPARGDFLQFRITFAEKSLPHAQAALLLRQLEATLLDTVSVPGAACIDMSRLNRGLLSITPPKEPILPSQVQLLHQFVEVKAQQHPDRIAFEFATSSSDTKIVKKQWSYHELNAEGNKVANILTGEGVVTGDLVAICFDKCPQASFAILGILKAGCAYVALDPTAPLARRCFILQDSQAKLILGMKEQVEALQEHIGLTIISLDSSADMETLPSSSPVLNGVVYSNNTCYCLYTSGTTGTPKGCEVTHENAVQAMLSFQRIFEGHWDDRSRWLQFASFHFDVSVLEQYWSWSVGICVTSAPRDLIFQDIAGTIQQLEITHIDLTPSLASTLHPDDVPSLCRGVFITGGEQLKQEILDVWGPKGVIYNGYGPTEATIGCTMFPRVPQNGKPSNIGLQFDNVGTYVLRPNSSIPVLRGAVGELCVSGSLVSRGYLFRPKLTEEKFPILTQFDERVYRTGDLVRILHDNTFDFLGRADDQVKLRGQRLEIGEINVVVKSASYDIQECVTLVLQHPKQLKEQLVSFLVSKIRVTPNQVSHVRSSSESKSLVASVRDECLAKLPSYMVPTHFVLLTSIPLSANNKADAKQLTAIYERITLEELQGQYSGLGGESSTGWSDEEKVVADVLSRELGLPCEVDQRSCSFFELGLDSITVISFARLLREAGFLGATTSLIMSNPTLSKLARVLCASESQDFAMCKSLQAAQQRIAAFAHKHTCLILEDLQISREAIEGIVPCTPLQDGMLSRSLGSDKPTYFAAFLFEIEPSTELARLKSAWARVIANTQILRTCFISTSEGHAQVAMRTSETPWSEISVAVGLEEQATHDRYEKWCSGNHNEAKRPFELVIVQSSVKSIMCVHMFHAVYDGISLHLVMERLKSEYWKAHVIDYGPAFHKALSYGPLRHVDGAEAFWTQHLAQSRSSRMPPLTPRPLACDSTVTLVVSGIKDLDERRRSLDATHQAVLQACWVAVLQKYLSASVTLGMVVSGRSAGIDKAELTIGPLFNTIPFHVALGKSETWRSLISKCQGHYTAALPFQHTPLRDITRWCKRSPANPLFDTLFVFQRVPNDLTTAAERLWTPLESKSQADYPLAFEAEQEPDGTLKLTIVAQGNISSAKSSLQLLEALKSNIFQMLADPDALIYEGSDIGSQTTKDMFRPSEASAGAGETTTRLAEPFSWSIEAYGIRDEIADLADVEKDVIKEHTSIFELGLDSIDAIKLSSRLKRRGIDLPVSMLMKLPTVAGMTEHSSTTFTSFKQEGNRVSLADFRGSVQDLLQQREEDIDDIEHILPVTPLQEAMVAEMVQSEYVRYFNHDLLKLMPSVDINRLEYAWKTVVEHSPILRTSFAEIDDPEIVSTYAQIIHRQSNIGWTNKYIKGLEKVQKVFDSVRQEAARNTERSPPCKLTVVKCGKDTYLIVSIAHALYDGWSLGLLHEDVRRAYAGRYIARPFYSDMVADIVGASGPAAATYWKHAISGAKGQSFPQRDLSKHPLTRVVNRIERISSTPVEEIQSFCRAQGITIQTLGHTCWACMLAYYLKALEVVFGSVLSGRNTEEANEIVFPCMNTVAIRSILHGTRKEMLRYMQEIGVSLILYQHFPLRKVQAMTETPSQKLFDTLFIYQKRPQQQSSEETMLYESIESSSEVDYPICVEMEQVNGCLEWRTACFDSVLSKDQTAEMLDKLDSILSGIVEFPDADVLDFKTHGISICGMPEFRSGGEDVLNGHNQLSHVHTGGSSPEEWSSTEEIIRSVLSHVSKTPEGDIHPDMTIFRLGLDSISAIKVSSLLRKRSITLTVSEMLQAATIRNMARIVEEQPQNETSLIVDTEAVLAKALEGLDTTEILRSSGVDMANLEQVLPASAGQTYMLSVWQNSQGALFYPVFDYRLQGFLDEESLEKAWRALVAELPILRTTFVTTGNNTIPLLQVVFKHVDNPVVWLPPSDTTEKTDFRSPPVTLYAQRTATETHLKLHIHHALYDGVSLPGIVRRLEEHYNHSKSQGVIRPSFADFLALELSSSADRQRKNFWSGYLAKTKAPLPLTPITESLRRVEIFRPRILGDAYRLETFAGRQGCSVQMLFLAAFAKVYATIQKAMHSTDLAHDTVFGVYLANRSHHLEGLAKLAAPTLNLVPLRIKAPLTLPTIEIAQNIQHDLQIISHIENCGAALWEIENWTGIKIDCFVNFLKLPDHDEERNHTEGHSDKVVIEAIKSERDDGLYRLGVPEYNDHVETGPLANNLVKDAYLPSLDVEATIREGFLDIGVFCPENILGLREAGDLINGISKTLEAILDSDDEQT